jgi:uncharacterized cupredoxin-like copper-binding protein
MNFPLSHIASLCKYTGISFTAGAITHGFFSERRSILTAAFGVMIYLIGGILDKLANPDRAHSWFDLLAVGTVASIGLGFFTGGLQHFPDSPARSTWVVPVGFAMSMASMYWMEGRGKANLRVVIRYGLVSIVLVTMASLFAGAYLKDHSSEYADHDHAPKAGAPLGSIREVRIEMDDSLRFNPSKWGAVQGETVRVVVVNKGKQTHELVIGREADLRKHVEDMKKPGFKDHAHHDNEVSVKPGQLGELIWTFKEAGLWSMGCLEDGHYTAGMAGEIKVLAKP